MSNTGLGVGVSPVICFRDLGLWGEVYKQRMSHYKLQLDFLDNFNANEDTAAKSSTD